ncbi:hypothetical protein SAMN04488005_0358 [Yoonia tamlensis]|uniref:Uncharacterized protein n=1 Tax=Yoonia tamlensis TaxID=390270 RepID=A0A1I6FRW5_9RHOB|nr:hypothetical protein [Yoonia tamlensis]SFR32702.1 hypothetical protein SAMN04488005_0358 [Yoonia tamlensis]
MTNSFLLLLFFLLVVSATTYADKQIMAAELVTCVNSTNGYLDGIDGKSWEPAQAVLGIPYDYERTRLAPDYYFVYGRKLGWHGTWASLLYLGTDGWMAFEARAEDDRLDVFAASFVPVRVVEAFAVCGVEWGGFWDDEYPLIEVAPVQQTVAPLSLRPLWNGEDLLPPKPND